MYDKGKIFTGLIIFLVIITFPIWYNLAKGTARYNPEPEIITQEPECVAATEYMRDNHMDLLNQWRDKVVRQGERYFTTPAGIRHEMSLSRTCMKCHSNKANFCDRCHNYVGVKPFCWDCHVEPKEVP